MRAVHHSLHGVSPRMRMLLATVGCVAIALPSIVVATVPRAVPIPPEAVEAVQPARIVPKEELPPVEPVDFVKVEPESARAINAAVPFSDLPNPAARAFRVSGAAADQARAVDCLAAAVYYEAGDDREGQQAVAQVVLNRVRHPAFPNTVCGVVFQGSERSTGCQFTFTCDGAMARRPAEAAWRRARETARGALNGDVYAEVGHATHYHTDWVVPYWSSSLEKITEVHGHLFFRWTGWWGTPRAFSRAYAGAEPLEPLLAALSGDHGEAPEASGEKAAEIAPDALPKPTASDPDSFLVTLDPGMDAAEFPALAIRVCGDRKRCKFMGWMPEDSTPNRLPLASDQVATMAFSYLRMGGQSYSKALWNCDRFDRPSPLQCMRPQPLASPRQESSITIPPRPAPSAAPEGPAGLAGVRRAPTARPEPVVPALPANGSAARE
ncbi:cell wall hydrolase [Stakelama tenebrarum]|uniref:Cell wall hydrolase n=1 Tax=Stakelama tenebrarum TaxID=2711215 RepID=A0A6G6Y6S5_9SPHN|nr:cell wall hydrolase [Sphingosinithalassobacter tenebrarum]QIG80609.1 cell wall hydrolase [Sphingosinithalassobacter tenebrarum]